VTNLLDRHLLQLCGKARLLEIVHDFIVFDAGIKKVCRHNQYFGVKRRRRTRHASARAASSGTPRAAARA
jgi:type I site-specific restriction-modification system R (restriction) subunit